MIREVSKREVWEEERRVEWMKRYLWPLRALLTFKAIFYFVFLLERRENKQKRRAVLLSCMLSSALTCARILPTVKCDNRQYLPSRGRNYDALEHVKVSVERWLIVEWWPFIMWKWLIASQFVSFAELISCTFVFPWNFIFCLLCLVLLFWWHGWIKGNLIYLTHDPRSTQARVNH